jgi:5-methylcytosine-specific restriction endonuclease McrA
MKLAKGLRDSPLLFARKTGGKDSYGQDIYIRQAKTQKRAAWRSGILRKTALFPQYCLVCGYDEHPSILEVHHIDKNRKNNELSNLTVLCPNCHSLVHRHLVGLRQLSRLSEVLAIHL